MKIKKQLLVLLAAICFSPLAYSQARIKVKQNQFIKEDTGEVLVFRGVNTSDPDKLENDGHWNLAYFEEIKSWGANIVRFPVHPTAWQRRGKEAYLELLRNGIQWAKSQNLYVIIDWHSIGNLAEERFFLDMYVTDLKATKNFWKTIAKEFGDDPTVAFYEIFNEPTVNQGKLGAYQWNEWKEFNESIITLIRKKGGQGIPLVAGFNWAYDLTEAYENPIEAEGVAYVSHAYPQKREQPWEPKWQADWAMMKEKYPVILTEIGFAYADEPGAHSPVISDESYGDAITAFCDSKDISYVIWVFDPEWAPGMFSNWEFAPTKHGTYFKAKMQQYKY